MESSVREWRDTSGAAQAPWREAPHFDDAGWEDAFAGDWNPSTGASEAMDARVQGGRETFFTRLRSFVRYLRIVLLIGVAAGAAWIGSRHVAVDNAVPPTSSPTSEATSDAAQAAGANADNGATVQVDVHGDVRHPGLVTLQEGARVRDAIRAAGGFRRDGDAADVNQAALVWDGEEIDIPAATSENTAPETQASGQMGTVAWTAGNPSEGVASRASSGGMSASQSGGASRARKHAVPAGQKININTADLETLETLPGVGPKRAAAIIAYRQAHGPFSDLDSLRHVKGIGEKTLAKWQDLIVFVPPGNASTAGHPGP
ncbi:ComEA family DNA-binding protein [Alicyclobacillus mali (ex Roth et al. 2021)]|uniref:ComEA family DNA-binding protein n=1 Tax=Alicyclobacillus mali (ex Roth et al. 2021) TaxID=1123961 RepID=UPI000AC3714A|nr:ComEA family DNA-binding protein [Alicyclobacillus mali (ex Roth et al. 2021)]